LLPLGARARSKILVIDKDAGFSVEGAPGKRAGTGAPCGPHGERPREPGLYIRTLEAAAATRYGLELLQELAKKIEGIPGAPRPLTDPGQVDRLRPGARLAQHPDPDSQEASTDLLDEAAEQLGFVLASGSIRDLTHNLDRLTDEGLREQMAAAITGLLKTLPPEDL
jgi:hypothetical protein